MRIRKFNNMLFRRYDFITIPALTVLSAWLIILSFPVHIFPDSLSLGQYEKNYEVLNLIVSSLVSLIGIYITVSLVAYEFFKQKSGVDFQKSLLVNKVNAYFISSTVLTILSAFLASLVVHEVNPSSKFVTLVYLNIILFSLIIVALFPIAFNLFSSLKPEKIASKELDRITAETLIHYEKYDQSIDEQIEQFEDDPLLKIESIIIALITVNDVLKARGLIQKTTQKIAELIIEEKEPLKKEYLSERLIAFNLRIIDFSLSLPNNSLILKSAWIASADIYGMLIARRENVQHFQLIHKQFFQRFLRRLFNANNEELIFEGIKTIKLIIEQQVLKNLDSDVKNPSLDSLRNSIDKNFEIRTNYSSEDFERSAHFEAIADGLMGSYFFILDKAILMNQPDIIRECLREHQSLISTFQLKGIDEHIQSFFLIKNTRIITSSVQKAFELKVFTKGYETSYVLPILFENFIEKRHPAARTVLQSYCYLIINLQKMNYLDRWFIGGLEMGLIVTRGELGQIALRSIEKLEQGEEYGEYLDDCIETLIILKEYYEKNPPLDKGLYFIIKKRLEEILKRLREKKLYRRKVYKKVKSLIDSFDDNLAG